MQYDLLLPSFLKFAVFNSIIRVVKLFHEDLVFTIYFIEFKVAAGFV